MIPKDIENKLEKIKIMGEDWRVNNKIDEIPFSLIGIAVFCFIFLAFCLVASSIEKTLGGASFENPFLKSFLLIIPIILSILLTWLIINSLINFSKKKLSKKYNKIQKEMNILVSGIEKTKYGFVNILNESIETFRYVNKNLSKSYSKESMVVHKILVNNKFFDSDLPEEFNKRYENYSDHLTYLNYIANTEYINIKNQEALELKEEINKKEKEKTIKIQKEMKQKEVSDIIKKTFTVKGIKAIFNSSSIFNSKKEEKEEIIIEDKDKKDYFKIKSI